MSCEGVGCRSCCCCCWGWGGWGGGGGSGGLWCVASAPCRVSGGVLRAHPAGPRGVAAKVAVWQGGPRSSVAGAAPAALAAAIVVVGGASRAMRPHPALAVRCGRTRRLRAARRRWRCLWRLGGDDDNVDDDADDLDDEDQAAVTDDYFMVKAEGICWADLREVRRGAVFRLPGRVARHDFPERAVRCRDLCPREAADRAVASSSGLPG